MPLFVMLVGLQHQELKVSWGSMSLLHIPASRADCTKSTRITLIPSHTGAERDVPLTGKGYPRFYRHSRVLTLNHFVTVETVSRTVE